MAIMTAQLPLTLVPAGAIEVGQVAALLQDAAGGGSLSAVSWSSRGMPVMTWAGACRGAAGADQGCAGRAGRGGFRGHHRDTAAWEGAVTTSGSPRWDRATGPQGPLATEPGSGRRFRSRRRSGASLRTIAAAVGVSEATVRRALPTGRAAGTQDATTTGDAGTDSVLAWTCRCCPRRRTAPVSGPRPVGEAAPRRPRVRPRRPGAPGRASVGDPRPWRPPGCCLVLHGVRGLRQRVLRPGHDAGRGRVAAIGGEPRAEGATRIDPAALAGSWDWTGVRRSRRIRRKITALAGPVGGELLAAMAAGPRRPTRASNPTCAVFYVDGHVRCLQVGARSPRPTCPAEVPRPRHRRTGSVTRPGTRCCGHGDPGACWRWSYDGSCPTCAEPSATGGSGRVRPRRLVPALFGTWTPKVLMC